MSSVACAVASYAMNAAWEITLIAGAGWTASRMLRRWGPQAQHVVWVAAFLLSVVMPALPIFALLLPGQTTAGAAMHIAVVVGGGSVDGGVRRNVLLLPAWLIGALCGGYFCGLVYFAARLLWLHAATARLLRESRPVALSDAGQAALERAQKAFAVTSAVVRCSQRVRGVVTAGKATILVPAGFVERATETELLSAFGHELAHIQRRDYAKNIFCEAAGLAAAFHPAMWWMKAQRVATREMICDSMVVEKLLEGKSYRQALLRLAEQMMAAPRARAHAVGIFDANGLEERIMVMKRKRVRMSGPARAGLSVGAALLLALAVASSGLAKGVASDHDEPGGTVYHPGGDVSNPVLVYAPDPEYPKWAREAPGYTHEVCVVALIVDRDGMPQEVHVTRSAGKDFDASAMKAVRQYRFKPGVRFGSAVAVAIHIEVNFRKY